MMKTNLENGSQIYNNTRSERDKRIFFSLLKNNFGKDDTFTKPERFGKGDTLAKAETNNQDMRALTSIKVEVIDEEEVLEKENSSSSCQDCSLMSKNRFFLEDHMISGHKRKMSKVLWIMPR